MALTDNIVAYYKLDTNNATQPDELGSYDGTVTNALYSASGKINGCYDFDGAGDSIDLGNMSSEFSTVASINMWLKLTNATPSDGLKTGLCSFNNETADVTHYPYTDGIGYIKIFRTARIDSITLSGSVDRGTWHMLTITTEPGTNGWKLYQNGSLVHQTTGQATVSVGTNCQIGIDHNGVTCFDGLMDEVGVWNKVLPTDEITELYNSGSGLQYPFVSGNLLVNSGMDGLSGRYFNNNMVGGFNG